MERQKIIDAIDNIKDAQGEETLALQLIRWYLTQKTSPPTGGIEGGSGGSVCSWSSLLQFAQKQALVGVMFEGIQRLPKELSPKGPVLLTWIAQAQMIERQSRKLNAATASVFRRIKELGAECCILKGQGNALLYQNPLARTPGDVDVWCSPLERRGERGERREMCFAGRERLRAIALALSGGDVSQLDESLYHTSFSVSGVPVELHPQPAVLASPLYNRRLQRWLKAQFEEQSANMVELPEGAGQVAVPTREFNLVYQLLHLFHHYFYEGIGLRQFVDYALLAPSTSPCRGEQEDSLTMGIEGGVASVLKHFGIYKFAGAVMYVLHEVFGLPDDQLLVPADKKRGKLLLADILRGGNFGHYDHRFAHTALGHNLQRLQRDLLLMRYYPAEALSEPFFRLWHFFWRKRVRAKK